MEDELSVTATTDMVVFGDRANNKQMTMVIPAKAAANKPGVLDLQSVSGTTVTDVYFWPSTAGVLRYSTTFPTSVDSDGTAVGAAASVTLDQAYDNGATINGAISSGTAIKLGGAGTNDNVSIYHNATDLYFTVNAGDLRITAADDIFLTATGGDVNAGSATITTTGSAVVGTTALTLGGTAAGAYIYSNSGVLTFYDATTGAVTLGTLAGTILTNPTVTGDFTITEGKLTWTDAANEVAGAWTFSNTTNDAIQIASTNTTGNVLSITANSVTSNGAALYVASSLTAGNFAEFYNGAATVFSVGRYGAVTIGGNAGTDVLTVTAGDIQFSAGNVDMDEGKIEVDSTDDETSYVKRNHATSTNPVVEIEQTHTGSTGSALLIDQNSTGNAYGIEITHDGDYPAIDIKAGAARTGDAIQVTTTNFLANRALYVTGASTGTSGQGLIEVVATGALAGNLLRLSSTTGAPAATANVAYITSTGNAAAAVDGLCLKIAETGAAQPTTYAVNIASTSNEALHVDAGLSLFDERVTITLADNTGPALAITNPDTTGNSNAVTITPSGTGSGLYIAPQSTGGGAIKVLGKDQCTVPVVSVDCVTGSSAWIGAATTGMFDLNNDGSYASTTASMVRINNSGVPQNDHMGHCLRIVDTGNAAAGTMAYPVYVSSNDATVGGVYITTSATGAALTIAAGTASFAGLTTFSAGLKTKVATTDTANPPTNAEAITAFGAAATTGAGFIGILDDANGHSKVYLVVSDGTQYWQQLLTVCA